MNPPSTFLGLTSGQWILAVIGLISPILVLIGIAVRRGKDLQKIQDDLVANNNASIGRFEESKAGIKRLDEAVKALQADHVKIAAMAESIEWIKDTLKEIKGKL